MNACKECGERPIKEALRTMILLARRNSEGKTGHYAEMNRVVLPLYERALAAVEEASRQWNIGLRSWPRGVASPAPRGDREPER